MKTGDDNDEDNCVAGEPPKALLNGFHPNPYFPYLHMGVNGLNSMMPQPVSMAIASAQAQLAMRGDPAANKEAKALIDQQEFLSRYVSKHLEVAATIVLPSCERTVGQLTSRHPLTNGGAQPISARAQARLLRANLHFQGGKKNPPQVEQSPQNPRKRGKSHHHNNASLDSKRKHVAVLFSKTTVGCFRVIQI